MNQFSIRHPHGQFLWVGDCDSREEAIRHFYDSMASYVNPYDLDSEDRWPQCELIIFSD